MHIYTHTYSQASKYFSRNTYEIVNLLAKGRTWVALCITIILDYYKLTINTSYFKQIFNLMNFWFSFGRCLLAFSDCSEQECPQVQWEGCSLRRLLLPWSAGCRHWTSVVAAPGLRCSAARGVFPGQGLNPRPLFWRVHSYLLYHGSPHSKLW